LKRPVLLVPGWSDRARQLRHVQQHLRIAGWPEESVHTVEFRDRYGGNVEHAHEIADELRAFARAQNADTVDIVAHSMGGLAVRYLLHTLPERQLVCRVIFLGTPHSGTLAAWLAWGAGGHDMRPGSVFLSTLTKEPGVPRAELISVRTPLDLRIFPGASAVLNGARNITVWCAGHRRLLRASSVLRLIQSLLESEDGGCN
jgi:triacylglycerol lipase